MPPVIQFTFEPVKTFVLDSLKSRGPLRIFIEFKDASCKVTDYFTRQYHVSDASVIDDLHAITF